MKKHLSWTKFKSSQTYVILLGIAATIWFLIRVIPKPSRAKYPCMQAAAPLMSSFIIYMLAISTSLFSYKKFKQAIGTSRYLMATLFLAVSIFSFSFIILQNSEKSIARVFTVTDNTFPIESNTPIGEAKGLFPGRVVWVQDAEATNEDYEPEWGSSDFWYSNDNANEEVIKKMLATSIKGYAGKTDITEAWDAIFKSFNEQHGNGNIGYTAGEKIAFKINLTNESCSDDDRPNRMDATPQLLNAILYELINNVGVAPEDITLGDPYREFRQEYIDIVMSKYPQVNFVDGDGAGDVNQTVPSSDEVLVFSGKDGNDSFKSTLPQHYLDASYNINIPCLKTHNEGGITLIAKNHQGSYLPKGENPSYQSAFDMHYSLPANSSGEGKYRHTVDYMGHEQLAGKALIYIIDGIWGGESWEGRITKFKSAPFNNDYPNSILIGQDPVALESVGFDILFEENVQDNSKEQYPIELKVEIADYLKQCASNEYWPDAITYDPEGDGTPIGSLGVFEHWNNPTDRKYSRNLGIGEGIEMNYINTYSPGQTQEDTIFNSMASETVIIDGKPTEQCWQDAEWNAINQVWIPFGEEMEEGDFEGRFKVAWDAEYLYVLAEVVDDSLSDHYADPLQNWWDDDCLEVFIDQNRSKGNHECSNNAFAYHVSIFYDAIDLSPNCSGINYKDHVTAVRDTIAENTYLWEMAFKIYDEDYDNGNPEASRLTLNANSPMGLAVAYCDNDGGSQRDNFIGSMVMTEATHNEMYQNADHFGPMVLIDPNNPNYSPIVEDQNFSVEENAENGTIVGTLIANDPDGDDLSYSIISTSVSKALAIDELSGELSVKDGSKIDYEEDEVIELIVEVSDGALTSRAQILVTVIDMSETNISSAKNTFQLYPNPSNGIVNIITTDVKINNIDVYNTLGQIVYSKVNSQTSKGLIAIDLSNLQQGTYYVKANSTHNIEVKTINIIK